MGGPAVPDHPGGLPAVPAMPVIREGEMYSSGVPFPIVAGLPSSIGWRWQPAAEGGPAFVIFSRGRMGGYKILASFPLTEEGWARAWQSLMQTDAAAAEKVVAALAARKAANVPVLIVTTNEIPGYRITQVHGDVFGLIVLARDYFSNLGASFRTLSGGEVAGYTKLLTDSRDQARGRMWREAQARGANAVVAMRFDCNEIGSIMSEIAAYGTAVTVELDA